MEAKKAKEVLATWEEKAITVKVQSSMTNQREFLFSDRGMQLKETTLQLLDE
ncbi:hypothetical protein [Alkalihalobacillus deserti]|uniref:hypothetical protein n=1 Tax=Alkalihalobacillus deserti TaxID=2879466 RepID=UPI001D155E63|nr:hypothetical protein [Alkalihalobacillus deserti]